MTTLPNLQTDMLHNPVAWREIVGLGRLKGKWFWRGMYGLTALLTITPILYGQHYFARSLNDWLAVMAMVYAALYVLVGVRTVTAANDAIVRERRGQTWELLMLTGVSTWRLVLGKWVGVMRVMRRDYLWLFALRAVIFLWASASYSISYEYYSDWKVRESLTIAAIQIDAVFVLKMALLSAIFLVLELMFCTALGVLSGLMPWGSRVSTGAALAARVGIAAVIGFGLLWATGMIRPYPYTVNYPETTRWLITTISMTLGDNGMISSIMYLNRSTSYYDYEALRPTIALGQYIGATMYLGLTLFSLVGAKYVASWQGVNEEVFTPKAKPKRSYSMDDASSTPTDAPVRDEPAPLVTRIPNPDTGNVFNLTHADQYQVELFHFGRHLGRLILRATRGSDVVYLQFANVAYLDAPSVWRGASVRAANVNEYQAFLRETKFIENSLLAETSRLYIIETPQKSIRLVAGSVALLYELNAQWA